MGSEKTRKAYKHNVLRSLVVVREKSVACFENNN